MIFRTITDDITGANKSIRLFGKSLNNFRGIVNSFKQNGFVNTLLNTPLINIDTDAIDNYNSAINAGKTFEDALATARRTTNAETIALIESYHGAEVQIERVTAAQKASTIAAKAHSAALKALATAGNMLVMWFISKGIELAVKGIDKLANASKHAAENAKELASKMNDSISSISSNASTLSDLNEEYQTLSKGVNKLGENIGLSAEGYSRYKDIISQVSSITPNMTTYFNAQGEKIAFAKGKLVDLNKE